MSSYVVTGASRGLGYEWITYLAKKDPSNTVIAIVRNKAATEARLEKDGHFKNIHVLSADITDLPALQKAAKETSAITGGTLDVLIHNAAVLDQRTGYINPVEDKIELLAKDLKDFFDGNVVGTAYVLDSFLPLIRAGTTKKVAVISTGMADLDIVAKFDLDMATPYSVSKAAANLLVGKYHAALGRSEGVLLFNLSPGFVDTREGKPFTEEDMQGMQKMGAKFAAYAPDFKGMISVQESVEAQMQVIDKATVETYGGAFVSHHGDKNWL
ncbi:putative oxidoreductase [Pseudocercospora fuligena]|uniref:Putative oxidoreductase n=1 Tax=Pseudocercospora fuligena TaxID=685502 RepID=A0A8H6VI35_9PEZI|nr:putative oxidoreductase [Pseudocercospora fuligena]